jgi:hypothetical protein
MRMNRRSFLQLAGASAVMTLGGCTVPVSQPRPTRIELLVTESPIGLYEKREVSSRAVAELAEPDRWYRFDLRGARPDHVYAASLRHSGDVIELALEIRLGGSLWKSLTARYPANQPFGQLWMSRGYLHDIERNTACFPALETQKPFEGKLWLATYRPGGRALLNESRRSFDYSSAGGGRVEFELHDGFQFRREWQVHPDGLGHDYMSRWSHQGQLVSEVTESVIGLAAMRDAACSALATASYCDRDDT